MDVESLELINPSIITFLPLLGVYFAICYNLQVMCNASVVSVPTILSLARVQDVFLSAPTKKPFRQECHSNLIVSGFKEKRKRTFIE